MKFKGINQLTFKVKCLHSDFFHIQLLISIPSRKFFKYYIAKISFLLLYRKIEEVPPEFQTLQQTICQEWKDSKKILCIHMQSWVLYWLL